MLSLQHTKDHPIVVKRNSDRCTYLLPCFCYRRMSICIVQHCTSDAPFVVVELSEMCSLYSFPFIHCSIVKFNHIKYNKHSEKVDAKDLLEIQDQILYAAKQHSVFCFLSFFIYFVVFYTSFRCRYCTHLQRAHAQDFIVFQSKIP